MSSCDALFFYSLILEDGTKRLTQNLGVLFNFTEEGESLYTVVEA